MLPGKLSTVTLTLPGVGCSNCQRCKVMAAHAACSANHYNQTVVRPQPWHTATLSHQISLPMGETAACSGSWYRISTTLKTLGAHALLNCNFMQSTSRTCEEPIFHPVLQQYDWPWSTVTGRQHKWPPPPQQCVRLQLNTWSLRSHIFHLFILKRFAAHRKWTFPHYFDMLIS